MNSAARILLVDDNRGDVLLARTALEQSQYPCDVSDVEDGDQALAFLRHQGRYAHTALPDVVILDLSMPSKDGEAVLTELRSDPKLCQIPVVIFSSSRSNRDIVRSYQLGAHCYLSKPGNLKDFRSTVQTIGEHFGRRTTT